MPSVPSKAEDMNTRQLSDLNDESSSNSSFAAGTISPRQPLHLEARRTSAGTAQCSRYSACQQLAGNCCPTDNNVMLYCCNSALVDTVAPPVPAPTPAPIPPPTRRPTPTPTTTITSSNGAFCSSHSNCPNVDVECCPSKVDGFYMDCCDDNDVPETVGDNIFERPTAPSPTPQVTPLLPPFASNQNSDNDLGPNVYMIDSSWTTAEIQFLFDSVFNKQVNNEMGSERYGIYFAPGTYGSVIEPLLVQVGYYTEVAGLGANPRDVVVFGKIEVYNRCFEPDEFFDEGEFNPTDGSGHCIALNNFWRSLSNLQINIITPPQQDFCRGQANFWAVSQASSMRRVSIVGGKLSLMDFCTNPAFASGGFMADTLVQGAIENGSQQQWISRNIEVRNGWSGSVWNQVFLGSTGVLSDATFPDPPVSTVPDTPINREKPFLVRQADGKMAVFVPSAVANTRGVSWNLGETPGKLLPLQDFFIATPSTVPQEYRQALQRGKHLLFTPGVYDIYETIRVERAHTVVLGLGHATLTARNGVLPLQTSDSEGIVLAGITVDAGPDAVSPILIQIGDRSQSQPSLATSNPAHPITLSDVYIRVGGPYVGKSNIALEINANHVLIDHTWIWRADHGIENFDKSDGYGGDNERWRTNTGINGAIVNGNNVIAMGLFVEHFQQHNLIWNGDNGKVYMFQSELAYEPPSQSEWTQPSGMLGYEAYKVGDAVQNHYLLGGGVYCYNRNNPDIITEQGFSVPKGRSGIVLEHIMTRNLSGPGIVRSIVNGIGRQVDAGNRGPYYLDRYASIDHPGRLNSNGITAPLQSSKGEANKAPVLAGNEATSSGASTRIQKGNPGGIWTIALASITAVLTLG
ncbi:unnamed protein product [Cylindrotheca closterium]|uniref:Rhamnogalacturonase A/B/Epimerase-like pectate lyase domain-containing protein n=1 Tax=Cylindrotheca closterium TaxID=2856 RepID=A0AAD2GAY8_9STRA|nr:unnamed protein product [Cylindrotheca closterium]